MAKITRAFRIDEELERRFDAASKKEGVEKTAVIVEAITKFVEAVEMKKFWDTDKLIMVKELYAPFIGKARVMQGDVNLKDDLKVLQTALRPINYERQDEGGNHYDIDNVFAIIDFENKICKIEYKKFWVGGLVKEGEIEFEIAWKEEAGPLADITEITVFERKMKGDEIG